MRFAIPRTRSRAVIASCLTVIAVLGVSSGAVPSGASSALVGNQCSRSAIDVPSCGVLWGMFHPRVKVAGQSQYSANYPGLESQIGRQLDIVKNYTDWKPGVTFPDAQDKTLAAGGRIVFYDWNAVNYSTHAKVSYQSIINGTWDKSVIEPEAAAVKAFPYKIFLDFNHENDSKAQQGSGTPAQYAAAYQHIENVFDAAGVTNVIWTWVTTGYVPHAANILASYPGAAYVDWIGYDPYNFAQCLNGSWKSPLDTFQPFYNWVASQPSMNGKPLMLAEYATAPGTGAQAWYQAVAPALEQLPRIKAAVEFDSPGAVPNCDVQIDDSAPAFAGFKQSSDAAYVMGTNR